MNRLRDDIVRPTLNGVVLNDVPRGIALHHKVDAIVGEPILSDLVLERIVKMNRRDLIAGQGIIAETIAA